MATASQRPGRATRSAREPASRLLEDRARGSAPRPHGRQVAETDDRSARADRRRHSSRDRRSCHQASGEPHRRAARRRRRPRRNLVLKALRHAVSPAESRSCDQLLLAGVTALRETHRPLDDARRGCDRLRRSSSRPWASTGPPRPRSSAAPRSDAWTSARSTPTGSTAPLRPRSGRTPDQSRPGHREGPRTRTRSVVDRAGSRSALAERGPRSETIGSFRSASVAFTRSLNRARRARTLPRRTPARRRPAALRRHASRPGRMPPASPAD